MIDTQLVTVDGQLVLHFGRLVPAPIEQVWRAVSEPEQIREWFLPGGPWAEVRELDALLGKVERSPIIGRDEPYAVRWAGDDELYDFQLHEHDSATIVQLRVPVDEPEDAPLAADTTDQFLDRLSPYLAGDELTWGPMADLDAMDRRIDFYAEQFRVDPARGREAVERSRSAIEESADAEPWHFEPSQEAADALEERFTAYVRDNLDAFQQVSDRRGEAGQEELMTALNEWILPSVASADEVGDRQLFVMDRFLRDESIDPPALESAWKSSRSADTPAE